MTFSTASTHTCCLIERENQASEDSESGREILHWGVKWVLSSLLISVAGKDLESSSDSQSSSDNGCLN